MPILRSISRCGIAAATAIAAFPAAASPLGADSAACASGNQPAILANVEGLKDRAGRIKIEIYPDNDTDFLKRDDDLLAQGKVFRRVWADLPTAGPVALCIRVPAPGSYGLVITHQREGRKKFNIWVDGVGLPTGTRIGMTRPRIGQARIAVGASVRVTDIVMQYLRGMSGFGPGKAS